MKDAINKEDDWINDISKEELIIYYLSITPIYMNAAIELVTNGYTIHLIDFDNIINHRNNLLKLWKDDDVRKKDATLSKYRSALRTHYDLIKQHIPIFTKEGDYYGYTISSHQEWIDNGKPSDLQALRF